MVTTRSSRSVSVRAPSAAAPRRSPRRTANAPAVKTPRTVVRGRRRGTRHVPAPDSASSSDDDDDEGYDDDDEEAADAGASSSACDTSADTEEDTDPAETLARAQAASSSEHGLARSRSSTPEDPTSPWTVDVPQPPTKPDRQHHTWWLISVLHILCATLIFLNVSAVSWARFLLGLTHAPADEPKSRSGNVRWGVLILVVLVGLVYAAGDTHLTAVGPALSSTSLPLPSLGGAASAPHAPAPDTPASPSPAPSAGLSSHDRALLYSFIRSHIEGAIDARLEEISAATPAPVPATVPATVPASTPNELEPRVVALEASAEQAAATASALETSLSALKESQDTTSRDVAALEASLASAVEAASAASAAAAAAREAATSVPAASPSPAPVPVPVPASVDVAQLREDLAASFVTLDTLEAEFAHRLGVFRESLPEAPVVQPPPSVEQILAAGGPKLQAWIDNAVATHVEGLELTAGVATSVTGVTRATVAAMIRKELQEYAADHTGRVDWATNGFILDQSADFVAPEAAHTTAIEAVAAALAVVTSPLRFPTATPPRATSILQPWVGLGDCWPMQGASGWALIQLSHPILVDAVSLEHIPASIAIDVSSAPRAFDVWGVPTGASAPVGSDATHGLVKLGAWEYTQEDGEYLRIFQVEDVDARSQQVDAIKVRVLSNAGNDDYTCLYRFRVHGHATPASTGDEH